MNTRIGLGILAVVSVASLPLDATAWTRDEIARNLDNQATAIAGRRGPEAGDTRGGPAAGCTRSIGVVVCPGGRPSTNRPPLKEVAATPDEPPLIPEESRIDLRITFETNSAVIRPESAGLLGELCAALAGKPQSWTFNIIGHADASGPDGLNRRLSVERAQAVSRHLDRNCGIDPTRLRVYGLGNSRLLPDVPPISEANRRVELSVNSI